MSETRTEGPTPAGGAYAIAYWFDSDGRPCEPADARSVEVVEYDEAGHAIARTYAELTG